VKKPGLALAFILSAHAVPAAAADGAWLRRQIENAKAGGAVQIPAGVHDLTDMKISRSLTLVGATDGKTVLRSASVTEKGILVPLSGVDLRVENLTFEGARSWDRNGAGIRHEGRNLTIVNCRFVSNEDGVLATGDADGTITIRNSAFIDNGFGDGLSHGIYMSNGFKLDIDKSRFEGTRIGHHVKSLAEETIVRNSVLDDGYGRGSYALDASKGGAVTFEGNTVTQSADAENNSIINYDISRAGAAVKLAITGNTFINRLDGGNLLRNETKLAPVFSDNKIVNEGKRPMKAPPQKPAKPAAGLRN
jgi:hypothetical protein